MIISLYKNIQVGNQPSNGNEFLDSTLFGRGENINRVGLRVLSMVSKLTSSLKEKTGLLLLFDEKTKKSPKQMDELTRATTRKYKWESRPGLVI